MIREGGVDGLSLRELARQAGVSHGAPRSHFIDRQALLDAVAEQGFHRLTAAVTTALREEGTVEERFRRVAHAYVDFAADDAALMELMFTAKAAEPSEQLQHAASGLFGVLDEALAGERGDDTADAGRTRFKLLFAAIMQGTATLIASRRVSRVQGDAIVDDAVGVLLESHVGRRVLRLP